MLVAGTLLAGVVSLLGKNPTKRPDLLLHTVIREPLLVTITERGALEAADNCDITCQVKAKTAGGAASSIKWLIDEGTKVQPGDRLMELDDSAQQDNLKNAKIAMDQAEDDYSAALANLEVQLSQNVSDIATQELALKVAQINLEKYVLGDYMQAKHRPRATS